MDFCQILLTLILLRDVESNKWNSSLWREKGGEAEDLISKAVSWFPKGDLSAHGYPLFNQKIRKHSTIYQNLKRPGWRLKTKTRDRDAPIVIIDKGRDPSHPFNTHVFIVLIQSQTRPSKYTGHRAYIREWRNGWLDGHKSVEWDLPLRAISNIHENILTAFTPSAFMALNGAGQVAQSPTQRRTNNREIANASGNHKNKLSKLKPHRTTTKKPKGKRDKKHRKEKSGKPESKSHERKAIEKLNLEREFESDELKIKKIKNSEGDKFENKAQESEEQHKSTNLSNQSEEVTIKIFADSLEIDVNCPEGSGGIVVGNRCICPMGMTLILKKCVEEAREGRVAGNGKNKKKSKKTCPRGQELNGKKCKKSDNSKELDDAIIGSNEVITEPPSIANSIVNPTYKCPPKSGAILVDDHCICPNGTKYKKSKNKCVRVGSLKPISEVIVPEGERWTDATSTKRPETTSTTPSSLQSNFLDEEERRTTEGSTLITTTTTAGTTESIIPYISEDIPSTKTDRMKLPSHYDISDSDSEETETETTTEPPKHNQQESEEIKNWREIEESEETRTTTPSVESSAQSTPAHFQKARFTCPKESGAFLKADRCYCPTGTLLKRRKCIPKPEISTQKPELKSNSSVSNITDGVSKGKGGQMKLSEQFQLETDASTTIDILVVNNLKKRGAEFRRNSEYSSEEIGRGNGKVEKLKTEDSGYRRSGLEGVESNLNGKELKSSLEMYSIGNDKESGHPIFESKKLWYTGLLNCKFVQKRVKDFDESLAKAVLDFYLHSLRAQCYEGIRRNTVSLFSQHLLSLLKDNYNIIRINLEHKLLKKKALNEEDWQKVISGIFLSKYSEAVSEREMNDVEEGDSESGVSRSVGTLTLIVEKILALLESKNFRRHAVKIVRAVENSVGEWVHRSHRLVLILNIFCRACEAEREVNEGDNQHLILLKEFIKQAAPAIVTGTQLTFKQFYHNKIIA